MDILLTGADLPTGCSQCELASEECFGSWRCRYVSEWGGEGRAADCPMVGVQPHGDLVDIEALKGLLLDLRSKNPNLTVSDIFREIPELPIVIKANI